MQWNIHICDIYIYTHTYNEMYIYTNNGMHTHNICNEILFSLIKEGNAAVCNNIDEPGLHNAK